MMAPDPLPPGCAMNTPPPFDRALYRGMDACLSTAANTVADPASTMQKAKKPCSWSRNAAPQSLYRWKTSSAHEIPVGTSHFLARSSLLSR